MGEIIKKHKKIIYIIVTLYFLLDLSISIPNVSAPPPAPKPDQFIAEIFPNSTLPLQLIYTNTVITFNATDFSNKIDIYFDANYSIYNPENTTIVPAILPFSLATNISNFMFDVHVNNTHNSYDLFSVFPWNENITEINVNLPVIDIYPIALIRTNVTLLKNSTSVIRYCFSGSISNPLDSRELFYIVYSLGTSQDWIENTTGKVELRVYGKEPVFVTSGNPPNHLFPQYVDINGGKSFSYEWNNINTFVMDVGVQYYAATEDGFIIIIIVNISIYIAIAIIIILVIIIRKNRKKIESM